LAITRSILTWSSLLLLPAVSPQTEPRELRLVAEMSIKSSESDTTLPDRILVVEVGRDRAIYLLSPTQPSILQYDARGVLRRRIGRAGSGPGEFGRPVAMGWQGDTLWVADQSLRRVQFFSPGGRLIRTRSGDRWGHLVPLADGSYLAGRGMALDASQAPVVRLSADLKRADTVAILRWRALPQLKIATGSGSFIVGAARFTDRAERMVPPRGDAIYLIEPDPNPTARAAAIRVRVLESSGRLRWEKRIPYNPVPLSNRRFEEAVEGLASGHDGAGKIDRGAVRKAMARPQFLPAVAQALAATNGDLWLRWEQDSEVRPEWTVLSRQGVIIGRFRFPAGLIPLRIDGDRVYAVITDNNDLPELVRYRMEGLPGVRP
jgi:hypothetical protein